MDVAVTVTANMLALTLSGYFLHCCLRSLNPGFRADVAVSLVGVRRSRLLDTRSPASKRRRGFPDGPDPGGRGANEREMYVRVRPGRCAGNLRTMAPIWCRNPTPFAA